MVKIIIFVALVAFSFAGMAKAKCEQKTELRETFPYYDESLDALWVRVNSHIDGLELSGVNVRVINEGDAEKIYPIQVPHMIEIGEGQAFKLPDGVQLVELEARYSGDCNSVVYRQQFQDELVSFGLDTFTIDWVGKGFLYLHVSFTQSPDNTIFVE